MVRRASARASPVSVIARWTNSSALSSYSNTTPPSSPESWTARETIVVSTVWRSSVELTARPTSFGSVFVTYFTDRDVRSFDDALTSDAELYVGFHREMTERGFLMLPLNLKRNHLMASHSDEDVARMLEAAEDVLGEFARNRRRPAQPTRVGSPTPVHGP